MTDPAAAPLLPSPNGKQVVTFSTLEDWRAWLEANADQSDGVWVVYGKKSSGLPGPLYEDLVEEALCFGWIDSVNRPGDEDRRLQWFSPRRKGSIWSARNKGRIERLIAEGRMTARGLAVIEAAKADGSWTQFDDAEALVVHPDLQAALDSDPAVADAWESLPPSQKKQDLWSVYSAKRAETRASRIEKLISRLADSAGQK